MNITIQRAQRLFTVVTVAVSSLFSNEITAQDPKSYSFSSGQGTWSEIDALVPDAEYSASNNLDEKLYTVEFPNGFSFPYMGENKTNVKISTNGFIAFGSSPSVSHFLGYSANNDYGGAISAFTLDAISSQIEGEKGRIDAGMQNGEFVIQWKNFTKYQHKQQATNKYLYNMQIRLNGNGEIKIVYNFVKQGNPDSQDAVVGLLGTGVGNFHFRKTLPSVSDASNFANTTKAVPSDVNAKVQITKDFLPTGGYTYTFVPPAPCVAPMAPVSVTLSKINMSISGVITAPSTAPDAYLVIRTPEGTTPEVPEDGTNYTTGNNLGGYVSYIVTNEFTHLVNTQIIGDTNYTFTIYSINDACQNTKYSPTAAMASIVSNPVSPEGLTLSDVTENSFKVSWNFDGNGLATLEKNAIIEVSKTNDFDTQIAGSPFTAPINATQFTIQNLESSTTYFVRLRTKAGESISTYSVTKQIQTTCTAVENIDEPFVGNQAPNCWELIETSNDSNSFNKGRVVYEQANGAAAIDSKYTKYDGTVKKLILVSPQITNFVLNKRISLLAKKDTNTNVSLKIVALSTNTNDAQIHEIGEITNNQLSSSEFNKFDFDITQQVLDAIGSGKKYIGISRIDHSASFQIGDVYIKDFTYQPIPPCDIAINKITMVKLSPVSSVLKVSYFGNQKPANGYEYVIKTENTPPTNADTIVHFDAVEGETQFAIENLMPETLYYLFVRAVCNDTDKGNWKKEEFKTKVLKTLPWVEHFTETNIPKGWEHPNTNAHKFAFKKERGSTGTGETEINVTKNLYSSSKIGVITTPVIGKILQPETKFSFYYKQGAYSAPYAPLTQWGNIKIEVSTDFGQTWTDFATIENTVTNEYTKAEYNLPLETYQDKYVQFKITATHTHGDYDLSFDFFELKAPAVKVTEIQISTTKNTLTQVGETTTVTATVTPDNAENKQVEWVSANDNVATIDQNGVVTAVSNGTTTITAKSKDGSNVVSNEIIITVNIPSANSEFDKSAVTVYPNPSNGVFYINSNIDISKVEVYNAIGQLIKSTNDKQIDISGAVSGTYFIKVYTTSGAYNTYKVLLK